MASSPASQVLWDDENRIFSTWQQREPGLLRDGALGGPDSTWTASPVRVLFALKEPNDSGGRWSRAGADLRLQVAAFAHLRSTFPVVLLLARLAQETARDPSLSLPFPAARAELNQLDVRRRLLGSLALVNLKKTPGGPVCNDRSLATAVQAHGPLLRRQLELYRPHLTIAGGAAVHRLLADLFETSVEPAAPPFTRPFFRHPTLGLCLSFFHPQATKGYEHLYHLLRENLLAHRFCVPPPLQSDLPPLPAPSP